MQKEEYIAGIHRRNNAFDEEQQKYEAITGNLDEVDDNLGGIEDYDEWLETLINPPNKMLKKFGNKMKAKLILQFYKRKIHRQKGIIINTILWRRLPEDGIIRWPDHTKNVFQLNLNHLNDILRRIDQLHLSPEFLKNIKPPQNSINLESKCSKACPVYYANKKENFKFGKFSFKKKTKIYALNLDNHLSIVILDCHFPLCIRLSH